jgi:hypothetical protein
MREGLLTGGEPPQQAADILVKHIAMVLGSMQSGLPLDRIETFVAIGGDARFAATDREASRLTGHTS